MPGEFMQVLAGQPAKGWTSLFKTEMFWYHTPIQNKI